MNRAVVASCKSDNCDMKSFVLLCAKINIEEFGIYHYCESV
jgi:hypothetical protein